MGTGDFCHTLTPIGSDFGSQFLTSYGSLHPGYSISPAGSVVGLVYGFICGFAGLYVLAWLYNWFDKKK